MPASKPVDRASASATGSGVQASGPIGTPQMRDIAHTDDPGVEHHARLEQPSVRTEDDTHRPPDLEPRDNCEEAAVPPADMGEVLAADGEVDDPGTERQRRQQPAQVPADGSLVGGHGMPPIQTGKIHRACKYAERQFATDVTLRQVIPRGAAGGSHGIVR